MSDLDRSKREKQLLKAQKKRAKQDEKARARESRANAKQSKAKQKSTFAHKETNTAMVFMFTSSLIILAFFILFEVLLYLYSGGWGSVESHLLNMADNTLAFVIGLGAMDAVTYFNRLGRDKRNEIRAIVRHDRLIEPSIDMFVARKNSLCTPEGNPVDQYAVKKATSIGDMVSMFSASPISSDAGMSRIGTYSVQQKKLYKSFEKMIEEVDFSFSPDAGEAAMKFINASTYGLSSLNALIAASQDKTKRDAIVKAIKQEAAKPSPEAAERPELMAVYILMQTIREQEEALEQYQESVSYIRSK